jgi:hypothetical protein
MKFPTFFLTVAIKVATISMVIGIFRMMCSGNYIVIFLPSPLLLPLLGIFLVIFIPRTTLMPLPWAYVTYVLFLYTNLIHCPYL